MRNSSSWRRACAGASLTALVFGGLALAPAGAQAPPPAAADSSPPELVVTATRVDRKGFVAPTPTTVLSEKDILVGSPNNLVDVISNLPQGTAAWSATAEPGSVVAGASFVDLRDLGPNRTLVLIDGARPVATEFTGTTLGFDMNMVPIALVKKVDVVTGGASASWGSDAVAGVVNIVMDDGFTGFKGDAQYGGSTEGFGGDEIKVDVAGGMNFAGGAGHVMAGFGYDDRDAIAPRTLTSPGQYGLISNPAYTKTNGQTQDIFVKDPLYSTTSTGGLITSGPPVLVVE
jgi:outer membrane receptor protein involved in Fe transport